MKNASKKQLPSYIIVISSIIIPGSGHVLSGKPLRGFLMICWMFVFGYITFQLTTEVTSFIGRFSGAFAVWVLSVLEVDKLARKKYNRN
ncbi:hypothetical protein [Clostridium sp.]|uniref:hypothetical protein n=1 Tax=Clostridium sp. TaxID=1506 RepID=UPI001A5974B9|nr:hypothetical protein [Clostridium sp.]MBK5241397.1 hypothetical protein [Clostridium sp.]